MITTSDIVALTIAALTGGLARDVFTWLKGLRKGRGEKRSELDTAWSKADDEARKRRIAEEFASRQTRRLIEAPCVDTATIEAFPQYSSKEK